MKTAKIVTGIFGILMIVWLLFSWVDILVHNDPFDGDYKYSPVNMFILMGDLYE